MSQLTTEQKILLKAAIIADPVASAYLTDGNDNAVAAWLNTASTFIVWKTYLPEEIIKEDPGFAFNLVDGLTQGKRDEWSNFLFKQGYCNPSKENIRVGIADVWSGTAARLAVQAAIIELAKRPASNAEKTLATGVGTTLTPGLMTFEGTLSSNDAYEIRVLP